MRKITSKTAIMLVLAGGLGFGAVAPVQAQGGPSLDAILPLAKEMMRDEPKMSEGEIRDRAVTRGLDRALSNGRVTPGDALGGYQAYRDEKWRLEEQERQRKQRKRERVLDAFGKLLGSVK